MRWFRRRRSEPPIDEEQAYARSYGERGPEVRQVKLPPRRPRYAILDSGEQLRRRFEERLSKRDEEKKEEEEAGP